jgi:hypothetical protein
MWQGGASSSEIGLFTGQPWLNRRLNSTLLVLVDFQKAQLDTTIGTPDLSGSLHVRFARLPDKSGVPLLGQPRVLLVVTE